MAFDRYLTDIRARRQALHMTQLELAHRADCSLSHLRNIEDGLRPRHSDVYGRLTAALDRAEAKKDGE